MNKELKSKITFNKSMSKNKINKKQRIKRYKYEEV